jgi:spore coat protein CotF
MNDEILMNNYLMILKSSVEVYIHGTLESSNDSVRSVLKSSLDETLKCQERTYNKMVENEWYYIDNISPEVIRNKLDSINQN